MNMKQTIEEYTNYLKNVKHYSKQTISSYHFDLKDFLSFCIDNELTIESITDKDINQYVAKLKVNKYNVTSINRKIVCLRNFFKFYVNELNENGNNPMVNYSTIKAAKRLPSYLFKEQIKSLLVPCEKKRIYEIRNQCIILLLINTGMRVSEIANLNLLDLDLKEQVVRVFGKGSKERMVFFMPSLIPYLIEYIENIRPILVEKTNEKNALFIGSKGSRITTRAIENILNDRANNAPTPFKVSPHMIRHTFATGLLNEDVDIKMVQELLGHSSLSTTQIYTHVSKARLKKVYENTHPVAKKLNEIKLED